jgi:hypothetical protein
MRGMVIHIYICIYICLFVYIYIYIYIYIYAYTGQWSNDERHGHGVMTYCSTEHGVQEQYTGDWADGRLVM